jgi:hypothetical protein
MTHFMRRWEEQGSEQPDEDCWFDPSYITIDRIIAKVCFYAGTGAHPSQLPPQKGNGEKLSYLIKWRGLGYEACTWETPAELAAVPTTKDDLEAFVVRRCFDIVCLIVLQARETLPPKSSWKPPPMPAKSTFSKTMPAPAFKVPSVCSSCARC